MCPLAAGDLEKKAPYHVRVRRFPITGRLSRHIGAVTRLNRGELRVTLPAAVIWLLPPLAIWTVYFSPKHVVSAPTAKLARLQRDPGLASRLGPAAYEEFWSRDWSMEAHLGQLESIYRAALSS